MIRSWKKGDIRLSRFDEKNGAWDIIFDKCHNNFLTEEVFIGWISNKNNKKGGHIARIENVWKMNTVKFDKFDEENGAWDLLNEKIWEKDVEVFVGYSPTGYYLTADEINNLDK